MSHQKFSFYLALVCLIWLPTGCSGEDSSVQDSASTTAEALSLASLTGTWSGTTQSTYYCEAVPTNLEFNLNGGELTVTGGSDLAIGTTGVIAQQDGQAFIVTLGGRSPYDVQFYVDPTGNYGLWVRPNGTGSGQVALFQKEALVDMVYDNNDVLGSWSGTAIRLGQDFRASASMVNTMDVALGSGLTLSGIDDDGAFSGGDPSMVLEGGGGVWESGFRAASTIDWVGGETREALYFLSYDKTILAGAFLSSICNLIVFSEMSQHKFALWARQ